MKSPGKIYLADQSGFMESSIFQRYSTFNYEKYYNEDAEPFGDLFLLNDDTIAGGKLTFFLSKADSLQIFIPITGGVDMVSNGKEYAIKTGQVQVLNMGKGEVLEISNPHPNDTINYIQIGIRTDLFLLRHSEMLFNFDLEIDKSKLIEIISHPKLPFKLSAGIFAGKEDFVYKTKSLESSLFAFISDGRFEFEGRRLKRRDGLALFDTEKVQLVAMDNNSWVFVLELFNPF